MSDPDIQRQFNEVFEVTSELGLIELDGTSIAITKKGLRALDETLMYLSDHPRPDLAKRAARLRESIFRTLQEAP